MGRIAHLCNGVRFWPIFNLLKALRGILCIQTWWQDKEETFLILYRFHVHLIVITWIMFIKKVSSDPPPLFFFTRKLYIYVNYCGCFNNQTFHFFRSNFVDLYYNNNNYLRVTKNGLWQMTCYWLLAGKYVLKHLKKPTLTWSYK